MSNMNPEGAFVKNDLSAYQGMILQEMAFCQVKDSRGELKEYKMDLIVSPDTPADPRPVVIFVHGGGFLPPNDKRQSYIATFARALTANGYAVVSPDYPIFESKEQRDLWNATQGADLAAEAIYRAYLYVKENAESLSLDRGRIALMGGSAGGMTCFYLLEHYDVDVKMFGNCWGVPRKYAVDVTGFPPTLSIHGTDDKLVSYALEAPIQKDFERLGIPAELITLQGAGHTPMNEFDTYFPVLLAWLDRYVKGTQQQSGSLAFEGEG